MLLVKESSGLGYRPHADLQQQGHLRPRDGRCSGRMQQPCNGHARSMQRPCNGRSGWASRVVACPQRSGPGVGCPAHQLYRQPASTSRSLAKLPFTCGMCNAPRVSRLQAASTACAAAGSNAPGPLPSACSAAAAACKRVQVQARAQIAPTGILAYISSSRQSGRSSKPMSFRKLLQRELPQPARPHVTQARVLHLRRTSHAFA